MWSCPGNMPKYYPGLRDILPDPYPGLGDILPDPKGMVICLTNLGNIIQLSPKYELDMKVYQP